MLSAKSWPLFKLTEASKSRTKSKHSFNGTIQSEHSLTIPFWEPVSLNGVAFPIKSSMDVIRVPIDAFCPPRFLELG